MGKSRMPSIYAQAPQWCATREKPQTCAAALCGGSHARGFCSCYTAFNTICLARQPWRRGMPATLLFTLASADVDGIAHVTLLSAVGVAAWTPCHLRTMASIRWVVGCGQVGLKATDAMVE